MKIRLHSTWAVVLATSLFVLSFHVNMADVNPTEQSVAKSDEVQHGDMTDSGDGQQAGGTVSYHKEESPSVGTEAGELKDPDTQTKDKKEDDQVAEMANKKHKPEKPALKKAESEAMRRSDVKSRTRPGASMWPDTVEGFGYAFNQDGVLCDMKTGGPFEFAASDDLAYNQKRYEALGEIITEKVYELLETQGGLQRRYVPKGVPESEPRSFIFMSDDVMSNRDKMLVLIHGSGVVRAGQWTRKLIINNSLDHGTQLPFIKSAKERGYSIVVLNPNLNSVELNGKKKKISKNGSPEEHTMHVWRTIISKAPAAKIAIVAHSFGGVCVVDLAREFRVEFMKRVFAVAFTDSVHMMSLRSMKKDILKHFEAVSINWASSEKPLDTALRSDRHDARRVSAGTPKHEWTSWASYESIFKFLDDMCATGTNSIGQAPIDHADEVTNDDDIEAVLRRDEQMETEPASPAKSTDTTPAAAKSKSPATETTFASEEKSTAETKPPPAETKSTAGKDSRAESNFDSAVPCAGEAPPHTDSVSDSTPEKTTEDNTVSAAATQGTAEPGTDGHRSGQIMDTGEGDQMETENTEPMGGVAHQDEKTEL